jgi:hypothetical protein
MHCSLQTPGMFPYLTIITNWTLVASLSTSTFDLYPAPNCNSIKFFNLNKKQSLCHYPQSCLIHLQFLLLLHGIFPKSMFATKKSPISIYAKWVLTPFGWSPNSLCDCEKSHGWGLSSYLSTLLCQLIMWRSIAR